MTYTTKQVAERWGVSPNKVQAWIRSGDLAAFNVASAACSRPRYRVAERAIRDFEESRSVSPPPTPRRLPPVPSLL